jgi:hypothetical protein
MEKEGIPLHEVILKYDEELQKNAKQAAESPDVAGMTVPGPEEEMPPPQEQPPGLDPAALI